MSDTPQTPDGPKPKVEPPEPGADPPKPRDKARRREKTAKSATASRGLGLIALLLAAAALALSAWQWQQARQPDAGLDRLDARLDDVSGQVASLEQRVDALGGLPQRLDEVGQQFDGLRSEVGAASQALRQGQRELAERGSELDRALTRIDAFDRRLAAQNRELEALADADRSAWRLDEAAHLLRLANDRLLVAGDPATALSLLEMVDEILAAQGDPELHLLRRAVARDAAALRAVPERDLAGVVVRLDALVDRVDGLSIQGMRQTMPATGAPQLADTADAAEPAPSAWRQGWQRLWSSLQGFVVVRRQNEPAQPLLAPQEETFLRHNLRLQLEQAQLALLREEQGLYRETLQRAVDWVPRWFDMSTDEARAFVAELTQLRDKDWQRQLPTLADSLSALRQVQAEP
jgi:uroporphyrin-3 C-methyltransferase